MAGLVDPRPPEAELPLDGLHGGPDCEGAEAGLLTDFTERGLLRILPRLDMALGEPPIPVGVADQEDEGPFPIPPEDDPPSGDLLAGGTTRRGAGLVRGHRASVAEASSSARPSMNCRTIGSVLALISSTVPTARTWPS